MADFPLNFTTQPLISMSRAIAVNSLSKKYTIGNRRQTSFRDSFANLISGGKYASQDFWALRDVTFEVNMGEVMGIIGRNGAGKSTLLKILSRITQPTKGSVELHGRTCSLLEVGTGFHPELTGRENIFLNGTILGMKKKEVAAKFDEIVEFSGVAEFLDTPVKRYSSGMSVRLAFAVAAHLEPEILIVDEVLAVGDSEFQKKCIGKMEDVASQHGRTVLFVSHNMPLVNSLCKSAVVLDHGRLVMTGTSGECISYYKKQGSNAEPDSLELRQDRKGNGSLRFTSVEITDEHHERVEAVSSGDSVNINLFFRSTGERLTNVIFWLQIIKDGTVYFTCHNDLKNNLFSFSKDEGVVSCNIPKLPLFQGKYSFNLLCTVNGVFADYIEHVGSLFVEDGDFFGFGKLPREKEGFLVGHSWSMKN